MSGFAQALSFFTIIPSGNEGSLDRSFLYYLVPAGGIIGLIAGSAFYALDFLFNGFAAAVVSVVLMLVLSGFNHLDGVLDSGDALMAGVPRERKRAILKDQNMGAGAIGFSFSIYLPMIAFLSLLNPFQGFIVVLFSELFSKFSYLIMLRRAKTIGDGMARFFSSLMEPVWRPATLANLAPILAASFLLSYMALLMFPISILATFLLRRKLYRVFGGINGDLAALNGEIVRLAVTVSMAVVLALVHGSGIAYLGLH